MLAAIAMEPMEFVFPRKPDAAATLNAVSTVDSERRALIEEIEGIEGATLGEAPMLFRLVLLCGGGICAGASGAMALGLADLFGRLI